jgi:pterin-4a-carbinolamine dehydratase
VRRVFISYRRQDTAREAHVLKAIIEARLRETAVFIDTSDIPPGTRWPQRLRSELARSSAALVLIGPDWHGAPGESDRLEDPGDWVRQEIETALATLPDRLLPVVVEEAASCLAQLPDSLLDLTQLQTCELGTSRWEIDVQRIVRWVADTVHAEISVEGERFPRPDQIKRLLPPLTSGAIQQIMASGGVDGWTVQPLVVPGTTTGTEQELYKVFTFSGFRRAFAFMELVARRADAINHHPDWRNVWNRVHVSQRTWDAGHVLTGADFQLAAYMNRAAALCAEPNNVRWPNDTPRD